MHCLWAHIFDNHLNRLIYFGLIERLEMVKKHKRRKSKYKYGGTKYCKTEEVRKHFVNPNIESFRLLCKLLYLQFGLQIYRSSRS